VKPIALLHYFSAGFTFGHVGTYLCPLSTRENAVF